MLLHIWCKKLSDKFGSYLLHNRVYSAWLHIRWISDRNRILNKQAYHSKLSYFYAVKIAKLVYEISKLIWVSILIGNPPITIIRLLLSLLLFLLNDNVLIHLLLLNFLSTKFLLNNFFSFKLNKRKEHSLLLQKRFL